MSLFPTFVPGTVLTPLNGSVSAIFPKYKEVSIRFPSRLNAMAIDPGKIAGDENVKSYSAGEIFFSIDEYLPITVSLSADGMSHIVGSRPALIEHAYLLMKHVLGFEETLTITVHNTDEIKHAGMGSSSRLISGVAVCINELYGTPLSPEQLVQYISGNHGEEVDDDDHLLKHVQSLGGSIASGTYSGGLLAITGNSTVVYATDIDLAYKVVIGIPRDYVPKSGEELMLLEEQNIRKFVACGKEYGAANAYNVLHRLFPAGKTGDIKTVGDVILEYRRGMGSVRNCSFCYDGLVELFESLLFLKTDNVVDVLAVSSVGPGIFALTKSVEACARVFEERNMQVMVREINNGTYLVDSSVPLPNFWNTPSTTKAFAEKPACRHVVPYIDELATSGGCMLDIGFGGGRHLGYAKQRGVNAYGIEPNEGMRAQVRHMFLELTDAEFDQRFPLGTLDVLPFSDCQFDLVVCTGVYHQAANLDELIQGINEAYRVLRPGGVLVMNVFTNDFVDTDLTLIEPNVYRTEHGLHMLLLGWDEFLQYMKNAGFEAISESVKKEFTDIGFARRAILRGAFRKI